MKLLIDELKNCKEDRERWKGRIDDIRKDLNNCRADGQRLRRRTEDLRKTNEEFLQKILQSKERITTLFQEKFINKLLLQRRDRQIREERRRNHRWLNRYNNDIKDWRRIY